MLELSALEISGEYGYRELTVEKILERSNLGRQHFYFWFTNAGACYAAAYASTAEELASELLDLSCRQDDWSGGVRAALIWVRNFLAAEPVLAKGILLEVYGGEAAAAAKRDEVLERLSRAIDTARREKSSRHSPPPIAARFILSAVEAVASQQLASEDRDLFARAIPDLLFLATTIFFGREAAEAELADRGS